LSSVRISGGSPTEFPTSRGILICTVAASTGCDAIAPQTAAIWVSLSRSSRNRAVPPEGSSPCANWLINDAAVAPMSSYGLTEMLQMDFVRKRTRQKDALTSLNLIVSAPNAWRSLQMLVGRWHRYR